MSIGEQDILDPKYNLFTNGGSRIVLSIFGERIEDPKFIGPLRPRNVTELLDEETALVDNLFGDVGRLFANSLANAYVAGFGDGASIRPDTLKSSYPSSRIRTSARIS